MTKSQFSRGLLALTIVGLLMVIVALSVPIRIGQYLFMGAFSIAIILMVAVGAVKKQEDRQSDETK